jgi:hypothetical protein
MDTRCRCVVAVGVIINLVMPGFIACGDGEFRMWGSDVQSMVLIEWPLGPDGGQCEPLLKVIR